MKRKTLYILGLMIVLSLLIVSAVSAQETEIFKDDFSKGLDKWEVPEKTTWNVKEGKLNTNSNGNETLNPKGVEPFLNGTITFTYKRVNPANDQDDWLNLRVRRLSADDCTVLQFRPNFVNTNAVCGNKWDQHPFKFEPNTNYKVQVQLKDNTMEIKAKKEGDANFTEIAAVSNISKNPGGFNISAHLNFVISDVQVFSSDAGISKATEPTKPAEPVKTAEPKKDAQADEPKQTISANPDVDIVNNIGMVVGEGNGITPQYLAQTPTRIQAAVMYLRLKGLEQAAQSFNANDNFADADEASWAKPILAYLKSQPELGMTGVGNNRFDPSRAITAQEYYKVMLEALGYKAGVDFQWEETITFAAAKGLKKAAGSTKFTIQDLASATVEALRANVKDAKKSLFTQLVEQKVIDAKYSELLK